MKLFINRVIALIIDSLLIGIPGRHYRNGVLLNPLDFKLAAVSPSFPIPVFDIVFVRDCLCFV